MFNFASLLVCITSLVVCLCDVSSLMLPWFNADRNCDCELFNKEETNTAKKNCASYAAVCTFNVTASECRQKPPTKVIPLGAFSTAIPDGVMFGAGCLVLIGVLVTLLSAATAVGPMSGKKRAKMVSIMVLGSLIFHIAAFASTHSYFDFDYAAKVDKPMLDKLIHVNTATTTSYPDGGICTLNNDHQHMDDARGGMKALAAALAFQILAFLFSILMAFCNKKE